MNEKRMLTSIDATLLAEALPVSVSKLADKAAEQVVANLQNPQWTDRFDVLVGGEAVSIPHRLRFASSSPTYGARDLSYLMGKCFETRSNDGYQRQSAVNEILADVHPWSAPFIIALIGEYVVEILQDIHDSLTPEVSNVLTQFIRANPLYWQLTQQRVASYWNVYYRRKYTRNGYVGFKLLETLAV